MQDSQSILNSNTNRRLKSLSQEVKLGTETYYQVEMVENTEQTQHYYYSWENLYVIKKYFELDQKDIREYRKAGETVQKINKWPRYKYHAIKKLQKKFFNIPRSQIHPDILRDQPEEGEDYSVYKEKKVMKKPEKHPILTNEELQNQTFKKSMKKRAKREKNLDFYCIHGVRKQPISGRVTFLVEDQMGDIKQVGLEKLWKNNSMQVLSYLQTKISIK